MEESAAARCVRAPAPVISAPQNPQSTTRILKCLIIAAGQGTRLRDRGESKPLVPVCGVPLIERVMQSAQAGGAEGFVVVTGYLGPRVRAFLDEVAARLGAPVTHVVNEDWQKPNGLSVLQARPELPEPFLLTMSDHLFDPAIPRRLARQPLEDGAVILAVDKDLANPFVDLDDVTRVQEENGRIQKIGKHLDAYNAFDTGLFYATPALFDAIEKSIATTGEASLSGGMLTLAAAGKARTCDVSGYFWLDVDDPAAAARAEAHLCGD